MYHKLLSFALLLLFAFSASAQTFTVTDTKPAMVDGLQMGFRVRNKEVRTVGEQGNFNRYALTFFVTNTTNQAKIMLYKQGFTLTGGASDQLVQFNCLNATGARLTTKSALLNAPACNITALVDDKDCGSKKTVQNKRMVQIGYWIQAGQTISTDAVVIVPLNQEPQMQAIYLANAMQPVAGASVVVPQQGAPAPVNDDRGFSKIRNTSDNTYINVETGILRVSALADDWWSAQWQISAVPGTPYFSIKNRWKGHYIGAERGGLAMLGDAHTTGGQWSMEPTGNANAYRFKNVESGTYLTISRGQISLSPGNNDFNSVWALE